MENFTFHNPTRIVFGKGTIAQLKDLVPAGTRILMLYGGGSIKKNGVYDQVKSALGGREVFEFGGVQPNPLYETLLEALEVVKKNKVDFILAVGGGSVLDGAKFVAAAAHCPAADPWDICLRSAPVKTAIPIGAVLTLPATGSESNGNSVVSRKSTGEKLSFWSAAVYPVFSIIDPTTTMSLPEKQVRNGIVDAFIHVMEQYATYPVDAALQDRQAESIMQVLVEDGPKTLKDKSNYAARANMVWSATQALNGLIGVGVPQDWATHMIGHELTAFYGIDHAESLAIVMPTLFRHQLMEKQAKLAQFGRRVWKIQEKDDKRAAELAIGQMEKFFHSLGMPTTLADYKIDPKDAARKVSDRFRQRDVHFGEHKTVNAAAAAQILLKC